MGNFYTDVIAKDSRFHSAKPISDLALLEPVTRAKVQQIIAGAEEQDIKLMVYETYRSQERQGTSLGANNAPVVASRVHAQNPNRIIHGIWGFQASEYGANEGIPVNVLFARLTSSDNPIPFPHLGSYRWVKVHGNTVTDLHLDTVNDPHPGDGNVAVQNKYLADMRRVIAAVGQA